MSNKYGLTSIDGSPSQADIDGYLNWCDANPPEISSISALDSQTVDKVVDKISQLHTDAMNELESITGNVLQQLKDSSSIIQKLIEPPATPDDCVKYCKNLVTYFTKPYNQMVVLTVWWTEAIATYTDATVQMMERVIKTVNQLQKAANSAIDEQMQKVASKLSALEDELTNTLSSISSDVCNQLSSFSNLSNDISSQLSGIKNEITQDMSALQLSANDMKDMLEDKTQLSTLQTLSALTADKLMLNSIKSTDDVKKIGNNQLFGKISMSKMMSMLPFKI